MEPNNLDDASVSDLFERFIEATTMKNVITLHQKILDYADLRPCEFNVFFPKYKRAVTSNRQRKNWKAKALFSKIEKRSNHKCYSNTKASAPVSNNRTSDINNIQAESSALDNESVSLSSQAINRTHSNNNALHDYKCLIIGSGPAGLRTAIELQLLGAERVVVVEKRSRFSRNNVLHLWPFVIDDLKSLGAKKFYGKFCAGSIDHISIRQLQLILLKVCLMIGCEFRESCSYIGLCASSINRCASKKSSQAEDSLGNIDEVIKCNYSKCKANSNERVLVDSQNIDEDRQQQQQKQKQKQQLQHESKSDSKETNPPPGRKENNHVQKQSASLLKGVSAHFERDDNHVHNESDDLETHSWDIIIGADGRRNTLKSFFPRKEFRGRLAIAITANFINRQTPAEACVPEISGLSFIYNQEMFNALAYDTSILLENICYYKDDTHYFVMTAKKKSLLERGVLISDYAATQDLLSERNVNKEALLKYAKDAAFWTTGLEPLDFALNHYGQEDCAMFDFTSMYAASNACKALRTREGGLTLVSLVGDSLLEPFWPTGSGCARGFLSSFDAAWMCRQWAVNRCAVLDYHGSIATARTSRNRNVSTSKLATPKPATYDKMALSVMAERESIYRILAQTTSENLQQNYAHWTLNPHTRYPNLNRHLILPSQVEHLIEDTTAPRSSLSSSNQQMDSNLLSPGNNTDRGRRIKSPNQGLRSRRSPKKLKSAGASPQSQPKNGKNRTKLVLRAGQRSKSRHDVSCRDDYYFELEDSYRNLADGETGGMTQYLNYRKREERDSLDFDDLFVPSISGTLPSSNNLSNLEARKARDIDECLRQRRQKTKITLVRDQLISQMRGDDKKDKNGAPALIGGNAVLFNEIKRMREQQSRGVRADSRPRDGSAHGPLSLLNSMRRCASFAERVKSFESKLSQTSVVDSGESTTASTPRTPIDNVKNLPQFATLQELFVSSSQKGDDLVGKSRIPVTRLTKEDWNVKCWEKRLGLNTSRQLSTSTRSLNKAFSLDATDQLCDRQFVRQNTGKPKKQIDVFQDRINQMANKLKTVTDAQSSHQPTTTKLNYRGQVKNVHAPATSNSNNNNSSSSRSQDWVNHLKRELTKGSGLSNSAKKSSHLIDRRPMNPVAPNKPIKKLFQDDDDDEDDDGIDVNKHYDHLCINRPTNKYLFKGGGYKSHLARPVLAASRVINSNTHHRQVPSIANSEKINKQQAHAPGRLASRNSSASSTLSDYSTNTGHSSSSTSGGKQKPLPAIDVECFRCRKFVSTAERITIGASLLHRICLTCANCSITLRSNEIQHYMRLVASGRAKNRNMPVEQELKFMCAICKPEIRANLMREAGDRLEAEVEREVQQSSIPSGDQKENFFSKSTRFENRIESREEFLNSRINYSELYKNIIDKSNEQKKETSNKNKNCEKDVEGRANKVRLGDNKSTSSECDNNEQDARLSNKRALYSARPSKVTPSPVQVTLPLKLLRDDDHGDEPNDRRFSIASSETALDGSEQVTLILPLDSATITLSNADPSTILSTRDNANNNKNNNSTSDSRRSMTQERKMIDEEELQRILHLDNPKTGRGKDSSDAPDEMSGGGGAGCSSTTSTDEEAISREDEDGDSSSLDGNQQDSASAGTHRRTKPTSAAAAEAIGASHMQGRTANNADAETSSDDDSSSLDLPPDSDEFDDQGENDDEDEDNIDMNSTCDDFITTEEFDATSDRDDENTLSEVSNGRNVNNGPREQSDESTGSSAT